MMKLDVEETAKYVELGVLCYIENGKKIFYKIIPVTIEESQLSKDGIKLEHKLIPLSSSELKAIGIEESTPQEVNVSEIDIEESGKVEVVDENKPNLTLKGDPAVVAAAKKILTDAQNHPTGDDPEKTELKERVEDLSNKLGIIAEKRLDEKRKVISDKINKFISDPARRAEMTEKLKTQTPDGVSAMATTMDILEEQLGKNYTTKTETPSGSAPMNRAQMGFSNDDDFMKRKFPNSKEGFQQMVIEIRKEMKKGNPQAKEAYQKMMVDGLKLYGQNHGDLSVNVDDNVQKIQGQAEIILDNPENKGSYLHSAFGIKTKIGKFDGKAPTEEETRLRGDN